MATWAQAVIVLAADLMAGNEDPCGYVAELLCWALAVLPAQAGRGWVRLRVDAGYFVG